MASKSTSTGHHVEQSVDHRRDVGLQRLDPLRREGLLGELAQPGVVGRVEEQESRLTERTRLGAFAISR